MHRLQTEMVFHDQQAIARACSFGDDESLCFDDEDYLNHETWIRPAFAALGDIHGLDVLDFGCGHGMASVVLSHLGARVTAFDLSLGYLGEARRRAEANGAAITFIQADGEHLPFADGSFDRIWGNAVLHHLDMAQAAREIQRVLRPGGIAVFCEPWGENPLLSLARRWAPYPGKERTHDEAPLCGRDLRTLRRVFPDMQITGHQLLGMARRVLGPCRLTAGLSRCDAALLRRAPGLWRWCRYVVLTLPRHTNRQAVC